MKRETIFSPCRKYRYTLWRTFSLFELADGRLTAAQQPFVQFIGLNPSTADETNDDPTIRRCIGFVKAWGFGAFCMTNMFPYRATDPEDMKDHYIQAGINFSNPLAFDTFAENLNHIQRIGQNAALIIAAWGTHGNFQNTNSKLKTACAGRGLKLHHLGLNSDGTPKHPLYLKKTTLPTLWK